MKLILAVVLISPLLNFCVGWTGTVVFEDDFVGSSLNLTKWEHQEGCGNGKYFIKQFFN